MPSINYEKLTHLAPTTAAATFARARFGTVTFREQLAPGLYRARATHGDALVALVRHARFEGRAQDAAHAVGLMQQMLVTITDPSSGRREIITTPRTPLEVVRERQVSLESCSTSRAAWVVSLNEGEEMWTLVLGCRDARLWWAGQTHASETQVWAQALERVRDTRPRFLEQLLPYPPAAYRPAINAAIGELPHTARAYARKVAAATLSGERHEHQPPAVTAGRLSNQGARKACLAIDRAIDQVRLQHLAPGTRVIVRSWEDEQPRPGRVSSVHPGANATVGVKVDYPPGYSSPRNVDLINPSNYTLDRVLVPHHPLADTAALAAAAGVTPPSRHFDHAEPPTDGGPGCG